MRKGIEQASGSEDVEKLENGDGVMPNVPWAPKCSHDRACKLAAYFGRTCKTKDAFRA